MSTRNEVKASITPNKVIQDPAKRELLNNVLAGVGLLLGTVMVVDLTTPAFDLSAWTEPVFVGYAYLSASFGVAVTRPNYPKF